MAGLRKLMKSLRGPRSPFVRGDSVTVRRPNGKLERVFRKLRL